MLAGLEPSNTSSSGKGIRKWTTPGNQLTRFTLHSSLKPITDNTRSKIKGNEPAQDQPFAPSLLSINVCRWINQPKRRVANVDQTPFSRTAFKARAGTSSSGHLPYPHRPGDTKNPGTRPLPTQPPGTNQRWRPLPPISAKHLPRRK